MAPFVLTNATIWHGGVDLTALANSVSLGHSVETQDNTTFGTGGTRSNAAGLFVVEAEVGGFVDETITDDDVFAAVGSTSQVFSATPTGVDGDRGYAFAGLAAKAQPLGGSVGDMAATSLSMVGRSGDPLVAGTILRARQSVSGASNGTGRQLGAVSATQKLYTAIHVFTAGTTATVIVESDDAADFVGATTRSTTVVTTVGGTWVTPVSGAITDTWWRARIASVTGSFSLAVIVGIR